MELYKAIKRRRSVRDYPPEELSESTLEDVESLLSEGREFRSNISTSAHLVKNGREFQGSISGVIADYGKVKAPHYMVLTSADSEGGWVEVGYRYEFVVLGLTAMGIGTCWIGKGFSDEELAGFADISPDRTARALIACGPVPDGELNEIEEPKRKDLGYFLLQPDIDELDEAHLDLLDSLRRAPSSINSQPWRVIVDDEFIHLYKRSRSFLSRKLVKSLTDMNRVDSGIGLAHIETAGNHHWGDVDVGQFPHPEQNGLEYIGSLKK